MSYIAKEEHNLAEWNVIFKSSNRRDVSEFDFGGDVGSVTTITRGRVKEASVARIQSLVDSGDHRLDVGGQAPIDGARYRSSGEPPLMVVYAIDRRSTPDAGSNRVALNATSEPISVSLTFPLSHSFVQYVAPVVADIDDSTEHLDMGNYHDD
jgi:hypothetical protein